MKTAILWLAVFVACVPVTNATNTCTSGTIANAYCQPQTINGHFIAVNRTGDVSNSEVACYTPGNVFQSNGNLIIQSRNETMTCNNGGMTGEGTPPLTFNYTSGYVMMAPGYAYQFGDWKIRAKLPAGNGNWPAIWMLGSGANNTQIALDNTGASCFWHNTGCEELDLAEFSNNLTSGDGKYFFNGGTGSCFYTVTDNSQNWHTYELIWTVSGFTIYVDGVSTGCGSTSVPATPMYLIINNAIGGQGGGDPTTGKWPTTLQVDYVQICSSTCNGGNTVFYDDFQTPVAPSLLRPVARMARRAGANISAGAAMVISGRVSFSGSIK